MAIINIGMRLYFDKDLTFEKFNEIMSHRPNRICIPSEEGDKVKWLIEEYHFLDNGDCIITYKGEDTLSSTTEVCKATLHDVFPIWTYLGLEGAFIELPSEIGTETNHSILKACPKNNFTLFHKKVSYLPCTIKYLTTTQLLHHHSLTNQESRTCSIAGMRLSEFL